MPEIERYTPTQMETELQNIAEGYVSAVDELVQDNTYFSEISTAIVDKDGGSPPEKQDMAGRIEAMEIARPPAVEKDVNFYDYDGQLLYSYTFSEAENLSTLPELPNRDKLTCEGWNYSLSTVKEYSRNQRSINAGVIYYPTDNAIHYFINFVEYEDLTVSLNDTGSTQIDWGDGTIDNLLVHTYSKAGSYEIKEYGSTLGIKKSPTLINILQEVWVANNTIIYDSAFDGFKFLKYIIIPSTVTFRLYIIFRNCSSIRFFVFPLWSLFPDYFFYRCTLLTSISFSETLTTAGGKGFYEAPLEQIFLPNDIKIIGDENFYGIKIKNISLPDNLETIERSAFRFCNNLIYIKFPTKVTNIFDYSFNSCTNLKIIDLTDFSDPNIIPTLGGINGFSNVANDVVFYVKNQEMYDAFTTATNWSTYADRFQIKEA